MCVLVCACVCLCPQGSQLGSGMQWMWQRCYSGCFLPVCVINIAQGVQLFQGETRFLSLVCVCMCLHVCVHVCVCAQEFFPCVLSEG